MPPTFLPRWRSPTDPWNSQKGYEAQQTLILKKELAKIGPELATDLAEDFATALRGLAADAAAGANGAHLQLEGFWTALADKADLRTTHTDAISTATIIFYNGSAIDSTGALIPYQVILLLSNSSGRLGKHRLSG